MKFIIGICTALVLFGCEKKKDSKDENPAAVTTTTGATPTPTTVPFAVELEVNSTDYDYGFSSARFYSENNTVVTIDGVKLNGWQLGIVPSNEYRHAFVGSTYTAAVNWEISSSVSYIPDTSFLSPSIPDFGFQKDISKVFNRAADFTVTVNATSCDSLICVLGGITKKIPGKTGISSIVYSPADKVQYSVTDSTEVEVSVRTYNYSVFTVRGKKWRSVSSNRVLSHFKYQ